MRLRLGHSAALDEQAFRPVDEADVLDALLEAAVFVLQSAQTAARGARHAQRLHEQHARERLGDDEYAVVLHLFRDAVRDLRLREQDNACGGLACGELRQFVAEFVGQRRVDQDKVKFAVNECTARFAAGLRAVQLRLHAAGDQKLREHCV